MSIQFSEKKNRQIHGWKFEIVFFLQAAYKMTSPTGGRVTVFQHTLPTIGPGKNLGFLLFLIASFLQGP